MQLKIKSKNLNLSDGQKELLETKVMKLQNFADRLGDESVEFRVEVRHEKSRKASDAYICQLTIFAPSAVIRAETRKETIEKGLLLKNKFANNLNDLLNRKKYSELTSDVEIFLEDFGRSEFFNPCPPCEVGDWCVYP